jgi:hypothetical protein
MQVAEYDGPCVYCGERIGLILPHTGQGVIIYKGKKCVGLAHNKCHKEQQAKKAATTHAEWEADEREFGY